LNEGDILYHPAGIWHAVSSEQDSISINLSMKAIRTAEFITQAIQGALF
jgi:ribosomal protein L16 Arg81 hydroxylase